MPAPRAVTHTGTERRKVEPAIADKHNGTGGVVPPEGSHDARNRGWIAKYRVEGAEDLQRLT